MFHIQPVVLIIDYDDKVMMMSAVKENGGSDDEADLMKQVKRALKLKLEIRVSQNLRRLWATSLPGFHWRVSRREPW